MKKIISKWLNKGRWNENKWDQTLGSFWNKKRHTDRNLDEMSRFIQINFTVAWIGSRDMVWSNCWTVTVSKMQRGGEWDLKFQTKFSGLWNTSWPWQYYWPSLNKQMLVGTASV